MTDWTSYHVYEKQFMMMVSEIYGRCSDVAAPLVSQADCGLFQPLISRCLIGPLPGHVGTLLCVISGL